MDGGEREAGHGGQRRRGSGDKVTVWLRHVSDPSAHIPSPPVGGGRLRRPLMSLVMSCLSHVRRSEVIGYCGPPLCKLLEERGGGAMAGALLEDTLQHGLGLVKLALLHL